MLRRIALRLRAFARRSALEREMRDEMDLHLARAVERLQTRGIPAHEARLQARREFGNVGVLQEEARDARGTRWVESLVGDVRFAVRHFARRPLTAVTVVLVLALGIGGHSAVFSMVQAYTLRPAPGVPHDAALVRVRAKERARSDGRWFSREFSYPEWRDVAALRETFSASAAWTASDGVLDSGDGDVGAARIYFVTDDYFAALGAPLAFGPGLPSSREGADGLAPAAMISHALWQTAFGGRTDVLGRTVRVNDVSVRVVGVAPPRFYGVTQTSFMTPGDRVRVVWLPLGARASVVQSSAQSLSSRDSTLLRGFARLRPGVSAAAAAAAVRVVTDRSVAQMAPRREVTARDADIVPLRGDTELPANDNGVTIAAVFGSVAFLVLLVACTNVSALVVGAAVARRQEIAIRLSLGASRARVVRQLLTESAILAMAGGALGLLVYRWVTMAVATQITDVELAPDLGTVAFTVCLALGTGVLFGLSPALHATRRGVADALKDSGAGLTKRSRLQRTFVVAQIVLTQPLLVGLAMLLGIVASDTDRPRATGVDDHVISLRVASYFGVGSFAEKRAALDRLVRAVGGLPGVVAVVPDAQGFRNSTLIVHPDDRGPLERAAEPTAAHIEVTSPGYFGILDIPILRGREIEVADRDGETVVIGDDLARTLWGGEDPIGKRFKEVSNGRELDRDLVVVGVFDSRYATTRGQGVRVFGKQDGRLLDAFLIRTAGPATTTIAAVRAIARREMPTSPIGRLQTLAQTEDANRREALQVSAGAAAGGLLALLLASIGLYGVVSLAVGQRRREIGIRMALGARAEQVVALLFSSGVQLSVIGLMLGLPLSLFTLRMIASQVRIPDTSMPLIGGGIAAVVLLVACIATWIPARRAATVDPVSALKSD